jgi:hypothetical protein
VQLVFPDTLMVVVGLVPEQAPPQLVKVDPGSGVAVSCTLPVKEAEQADPQFIPAGTETTVPVPVPLSVMVSMLPRENVAMQFSLELVTLTDVVKAVPEQSPPQPAKLEPESATAVSWAEPLNGALWIRQEVPQLIPAGEDVTVPVPVPAFWTVSVEDEKVAMQVISAVRVTVAVGDVPALEQSPPHVTVVGFAVSVTCAPCTRSDEQVPLSQSMFPAFEVPSENTRLVELTVPLLVPSTWTVNIGA